MTKKKPNPLVSFVLFVFVLMIGFSGAALLLDHFSIVDLKPMQRSFLRSVGVETLDGKIDDAELLSADSSSEQKNLNTEESKKLSPVYSLIAKDFRNLKGKLNPQVFTVSEIIWNIHDKNLNLQDLTRNLGIKVNAENKISHSLEVEVFSHELEGQTSTVLQLSYFDRKSKNKVFELARSYEYKSSNEKKSSDSEDKKKPD